VVHPDHQGRQNVARMVFLARVAEGASAARDAGRDVTLLTHQEAVRGCRWASVHDCRKATAVTGRPVLLGRQDVPGQRLRGALPKAVRLPVLLA
jgi:hypothetical protein